MPEDVTVREDLQVIQVVSHGDITFDDLKTTLKAILRFKENQGLNKVLVDGTSAKSYPSKVPVFEFGKQVAESLRGIMVAIVVTPETRNQSVFFETVARNRVCDIRTFDTLDAAIAWLDE